MKSSSASSRPTACVLCTSALDRELLCAALQSGGVEVVAQFAHVAELFAWAARRPTVVVVDTGQLTRSAASDLVRKVTFFCGQWPVLALSAERLPGLAASRRLDKQRTGVRALMVRVRALWQAVPRRAAARAPALPALTPLEQLVFEHLALGSDNLKIASALGMRERAVKAQVSGLMRKLAVENRTQIALLAPPP